MNYIPKCFYHKTILDFISEKLSEGIDSFNHLEEIDQERLTTLCMDSLGEDAYSVLLGEKVDQTLSHLKKFMLTADMDEGYELLNSLRSNAINSVSYEMNCLFDKVNVWRLSA